MVSIVFSIASASTLLLCHQIRELGVLREIYPTPLRPFWTSRQLLLMGWWGVAAAPGADAPSSLGKKAREYQTFSSRYRRRVLTATADDTQPHSANIGAKSLIKRVPPFLWRLRSQFREEPPALILFDFAGHTSS